MNTPWGPSQHQYKIAEGVWEVDTAGHGGILLTPAAALRLLSPAARERGWRTGQWLAYEEDCDWALFAYEQPELYAATYNAQRPGQPPRTPEQIRAMARESLARWHTAYLEAVETAAERQARADEGARLRANARQERLL